MLRPALFSRPKLAVPVALLADLGGSYSDIAFANHSHRHGIIRLQRENRIDARRLTIAALSGADEPCVSPPHARSLCTSLENAIRRNTLVRPATPFSSDHSIHEIAGMASKLLG
jgi:hypothetical protein